jgi:uncharacterized protein (TIGR04222 family)
MSLGPFDLTGGPFLQLYGFCLLLAVVAGRLLPRWLRPEGRSVLVCGTGQLAYLAGGASRFTDAVVMRLLTARALVMVGNKGFHAVVRDGGQTSAERSVLALSGELHWSAIESALQPHVSPVRTKLVAAGLMMDDEQIQQMRFWQTSPYFLLLLFGGTKMLIGMARDRPVGYLTILLILTAVFALIRWRSIDWRTRTGLAALARARIEAARLSRAPTATETDLAVALFGTSVLVGSGFSSFHTLRTASSSDSSSGSSDGADGSGCGGGGCGGCGSG